MKPFAHQRRVARRTLVAAVLAPVLIGGSPLLHGQQPIAAAVPAPASVADTTHAPRHKAAAPAAYHAGAEALGRNDLTAAEAHFARAAALDPANPDYTVALAVVHQHRVTALVQQAAAARLHGHPEQAEALLTQARTLDPDNSILAQHPPPNRSPLHPVTMDIEPTLPGTRHVQALAPAIVLDPDRTVNPLHLRGDATEAVRQMAKTFGIRAVFDDSVGHGQLQFDLDSTTYAEAAPILFNMAHVFAVPIDAKTILIARDNAEDRQRLERQIEETIFIPGQTVEQINDLANVIRNLFDVKQLTIQQGLGSLVLRAPADAIHAINVTLADLLDGGAEVVLDLKLYAVDTNRTRDIGFQPPQFGAYNVTAAASALVAANQTLVDQAIAQGLINSTDSVVSIAFKLIASGLVQSTLLSSTIGIIGGTINPTTGVVSNPYTTTGITSSSALTFNLALNSSDARTLEDVQLRVGDRQPANFRSGSRYPITTSTYSTPSTSSALAGITVNGVSASSLLAQYLGTNTTTTIPQISYEDLGLTLKATPTVQKSGRVSMHLDLKIESLGGAAINDIPILDSRTLTSDVTVNEGETALLVSTVSKSEADAVTGLPGLSELPGLRAPTEKSANRTSSELILLITPHVVRHRAGNLAGPRIAVSVPASSRVD